MYDAIQSLKSYIVVKQNNLQKKFWKYINKAGDFVTVFGRYIPFTWKDKISQRA